VDSNKLSIIEYIDQSVDCIYGASGSGSHVLGKKNPGGFDAAHQLLDVISLTHCFPPELVRLQQTGLSVLASNRRGCIGAYAGEHSSFAQTTVSGWMTKDFVKRLLLRERHTPRVCPGGARSNYCRIDLAHLPSRYS
jgi:hypothetical protein